MANPNVMQIIDAAQSVASRSVPHDIITEYLIAGEAGDVEQLYGLMEENSGVLEQIDKTPFAETPLHRAAKGGHVSFVGEIMALKPSFSRKLTNNGLTPLHLALEEKGKVDVALQHPGIGDPQRRSYLDLQERFHNVVLSLLGFDKELVRVKGKGGWTPFHYAAKTGDLELLIEILILCPMSILDMTANGETALHIALRCQNHKVFLMLYYWIYLASLNDAFWERYNLRNWRSKANKEISKIRQGQYLSKEDYDEIARLLCCDPTIGSSLVKLTEETRNALLVLIALLMTINFQVLLTPPGGTWQDDAPSHRAGTAIMGTYYFDVLNYLNAGSSLFLMLAAILLLPRSLLSLLCFIPICLLVGIFVISRSVTNPSPEQGPKEYFKEVFFLDVVVVIIGLIGIWYCKVTLFRTQQVETLIRFRYRVFCLRWRRGSTN